MVKLPCCFWLASIDHDLSRWGFQIPGSGASGSNPGWHLRRRARRRPSTRRRARPLSKRRRPRRSLRVEDVSKDARRLVKSSPESTFGRDDDDDDKTVDGSSDRLRRLQFISGADSFWTGQLTAVDIINFFLRSWFWFRWFDKQWISTFSEFG